ncbi:hypothetical protein JB92DRAFT_3004439 [Gautieria morchelliformis]|nr:hypothetical protein JB92DRAFT_3004439 [Gautieria morchelliformis]
MATILVFSCTPWKWLLWYVSRISASRFMVGLALYMVCAGWCCPDILKFLSSSHTLIPWTQKHAVAKYSLVSAF